VVLTAVGEVLVVIWDIFPMAAAEEATLIDDAFLILLLLAIPIFFFVLVSVVFSALRFRRRGQPAEDGPPIRSHRWVLGTWFLVTTALTIAVMVTPVRVVEPSEFEAWVAQQARTT
jgi:heme/copper-type cytochrome/quinol oxidase subunit 2